MTQKTIIFDFDGTIADTFGVLFSIYNEAAAIFNCQQISQNDLEKLRGQRPQEFLKDYGVTYYKIPLMAYYIKKQLTKHLLEIQPVEGMPKTLKELKSSGIKLGILTSNSKNNVEQFLAQHGLNNYFDFVLSANNLFGKDKALNKIIKRYKLDKKDIFYIGDETRDIEASKKANIKVVAVTWGFNNKNILNKSQPSHIVDSPRELTKIILNQS